MSDLTTIETIIKRLKTLTTKDESVYDDYSQLIQNGLSIAEVNRIIEASTENFRTRGIVLVIQPEATSDI